MFWYRFWDIAKKAGVAALGVIATALAYGLLPDPWDKVASVVLTVATYYGVYATKNIPAVPGQIVENGSVIAGPGQ